jgi:hypothetical protein
MIFRLVRAIISSVRAFVRAYDSEAGKSAEGFPLLSEWKGEDPYQNFLVKTPARLAAKPVAVLIFEAGRDKGESISLATGSYRLGARLDYEIVAREQERGAKCLVLEVSEQAVLAKVEDGQFFVNGHAVSSAQLVDQDECEYNGMRFFFLEAMNLVLESTDEKVYQTAI